MEQWHDHLAWLLGSRTCLMILDNVWDRNVFDAFDVSGTHNTILFTTRNHGLVTTAEAVECAIDTLDPDQARALLAQWTSTDQLPSQADQICAEVGNLVLGVAIAGAMVKRGLGWNYVLRRLHSVDLDRIHADFRDYTEHPTLLTAIEISISTMPFERTATLPGARGIRRAGPMPETAIAALWASDGLPIEDIHRRLVDYTDRSLARRNLDDTVGLHDLHLDVTMVQLQ